MTTRSLPKSAARDRRYAPASAGPAVNCLDGRLDAVVAEPAGQGTRRAAEVGAVLLARARSEQHVDLRRRLEQRHGVADRARRLASPVGGDQHALAERRARADVGHDQHRAANAEQEVRQEVRREEIARLLPIVLPRDGQVGAAAMHEREVERVTVGRTPLPRVDGLGSHRVAKAPFGELAGHVDATLAQRPLGLREHGEDGRWRGVAEAEVEADEARAKGRGHPYRDLQPARATGAVVQVNEKGAVGHGEAPVGSRRPANSGPSRTGVD
jgi:hypothetical protein